MGVRAELRSVVSRRMLHQTREGGLADKSFPLILEALSLAASDPGGLPLFGNKSCPGLFRAGGAAKALAQQCKDEGYLRVVATEPKGKSVQEHCAITEKGLAFLLSQLSPKAVLENFVRALESRHGQLGELVTSAQQTQSAMNALKATVEKVLQEVGKSPQMPQHVANGNGLGSGKALVLSYVTQWAASRPSEDCPLSEVYEHARKQLPTLTIGRFHDSVRQLYEEQKIYLHPWTGPLYELPHPVCALLVGHEIAYYASLRT
jgi:hypothetical protein